MGKTEFSQLLRAAIFRLLTPHCSSVRLSRARLLHQLENDFATVSVSVDDLDAALGALVADGIVEEVKTGYELTKAGLIATRLPGDEMTGLSVQVRRDQKRLGGMKHPGRKGVVVYENRNGRGSNGGLWYVRLNETKRVIERTDTFWGTELEIL